MKAKQVLLVVLFLLSATRTPAQDAVSVVHFWAISNADYPAGGIFASYAGINYSASALCKLKFWPGGPQRLKSNVRKELTKAAILRFIGDNLRALPAHYNGTNTVIIYYCGHGVADLSGGGYWVPGNSRVTPKDTSFEYLSKELLNIDSIIQLINAEQAAFPGRSRFVILSDCCSDRVASKWYQGIAFHFSGQNEAVISYDSRFLAKKDSLNSALTASANLTFDDLGKGASPAASGNKPTINEVAFVPEMIRFNTFAGNGNKLIYSSKLGEETAMVDDPDPKHLNYQIGPIARRLLLYARSHTRLRLDEMIDFLIGPEDAATTQPALVNRNRN